MHHACRNWVNDSCFDYVIAYMVLELDCLWEFYEKILCFWFVALAEILENVTLNG